MTEPSPFALASVPAVSSDPRLLTLHLDICRMRAELELLESRIGRIRASEAEAAADSRPFADRAEELVERTVASLLDAGRVELETTDRQSRLDAEARLGEASLRAQELLAAARADLAEALTERAELEEARRRSGADVVILPDDGLVVLPGDDLVVLPDEGLAVVPGDDAVVPSGDGLLVVPGDELVLAFTTPDQAVPLEAGRSVDADDPPIPTDAAGPEREVSEPGVSSAVSSSTPSGPATGATETARADVAFDVWLAMAPPQPPDETGADGVDEPSPPGWLRPLEAVVALVLVALLVAVGLVLVG